MWLKLTENMPVKQLYNVLNLYWVASMSGLSASGSSVLTAACDGGWKLTLPPLFNVPLFDSEFHALWLV